MKIMARLKIKTGLLCLVLFITFPACNGRTAAQEASPQVTVILPAPSTDGSMSVERALASRRSRRHFQNRPITIEQLSQILWAAYGVTYPLPNHPNLRGGLRTSPSAGALYPLEIYVIVGNVTGLEAGVYRYISGEHKLVRIIAGDLRNQLSDAALGQRMIREAPATIFYSAVFSRMTGIYGVRGRRYVYMEIGHSAQNVYLQAEALGLGTCAIGAFVDTRVRQVLQLPADEEPLYIMPIGYFYNR
ncbi:MAG: SagB/ThcOx family dehydrogenase [Treponema sp.]|nr:SagB/ThcOx family dehydrogenase [Treponema sp.]